MQVQCKTDNIMKDITMSDVAREAGVSITTVSHVVNKTRYVKSATREHVLNIIQKMEYQIEKAPSAKIEYIGIVVPNITEDYYISLIKSMETFASEEGFSLLICDSNYTTEKEIKNIELLLEKKISGLILSPVDAFAYPPLLLNASIPVVLVDRQFNKHTHTFVGINNYESGRLAAEYLMKQNCKRMGFIGYAQTVYTAYHRARGYKACMREFFPQLEPAVLELHYHAEDSNKKIMDFVRSMHLDALICATSDIGYQVVSTIEELGLRIPDDLKIVSYDDNRWMDYLKYPISVVSQPSVEIGVQAMEELIRLISKNDIGNTVKREIFLDVEIVNRLNP